MLGLATETMASSIGIKTAVSNYEHLNRKNPYRSVTGKQSDDNSEDEDFLPLKPGNPSQVLKSKSAALYKTADMNNSSIIHPEPVGRDAHGQAELFDDMRQSLKSVPVPVAWSPGMMIKSNPSLFITPQKSSFSNELFLSAKDSIIEPQGANKVPKPVSWSPRMNIQPDPSLFITPEKFIGKKIISNVPEVEIENKTQKDGLIVEGIPAKTKGSYSVRFDLPSSTSGEDTNDPLSESDSPITLRGCEMSKEKHSFESPTWKTFSPQRTYNPTAYSDESSLDESMMNFLPAATNNTSFDGQKTSHVTEFVTDNSSVKPNVIFSKCPKTISNFSSCHNSVTKPFKQSSADQCLAMGRKRDTKSSVLDHKPNKMEFSKSSNLLATKAKVQHEKKQLGDKSVAKAGPEFLSSPLSLHDSPPGSTVIREMKNNLISTEYSFPFEIRAATEDSEYEHVFARPEFNSTLKVRAEMDSLYEQEVDVKKAVEATLAKSEVTRSELNEKAAACTNRMSSQFKNLIDLNTSVESLCDRVVRMRTSTVPIKKRGTHIEKKSSESQRAPDLMEFFTSDLQKECPDLTLPGVARVTSQLLTSPPDISFDLYRHNRLWEGISDF